jgi:predicted MFS family arabinose efflux permease
MYGTSNIFWVPVTNIFGRRLVLVIAMLGLLLTGIWCGVANSFNSLLAARIVQGFFGGPVYTIPSAMLGDLFFLHEQGRAIAIYQTFLALGPNVAGIVGGYIAGNLGYKYLFWIGSALIGGVMILTISIVPETTFDRPTEVFPASQPWTANSELEKAEVTALDRVTTADPLTCQVSPRPHLGYLESLKIGVYKGNVMENFLAPWKALLLPGVWPLMLQVGALIGGTVSMSTLAPILLSIPPYSWGNSVGLINVAGVVGSILGGIILSAPSDWILKTMVRRGAGGLTEAEMRLPLLIPGSLMGVAAFLAFGFCASSNQSSAWVGMAFGIGMNNASIVATLSHAYNYVSLAESHSRFRQTNAFAASRGLRSNVWSVMHPTNHHCPWCHRIWIFLLHR